MRNQSGERPSRQLCIIECGTMFLAGGTRLVQVRIEYKQAQHGLRKERHHTVYREIPLLCREKLSLASGFPSARWC